MFNISNKNQLSKNLLNKKILLIKFFSTKQNEFFTFRQHVLIPSSLSTVEPYTTPPGNYAYMTYGEQKNKFNAYMSILKLRLYFCQKHYTYITVKNNEKNLFLLENTQKELQNLNKFLKLNEVSQVILIKYLLFYFSFNLSNSWYNQSKILRYIKRLYFFETGYSYTRGDVPHITLKNIYSHALHNNLLKFIEEEKIKNKKIKMHPFLNILKELLSLNLKNLNITNTDIVYNFFINLISNGFLKDNQVFIKEIEPELNSIIKKNYNKILSNEKNKIKIFLINYFICDFFFFLQKKEIHRYMHYNKKIFYNKRKAHSFFIIPKK